jgi:hypothetical protein
MFTEALNWHIQKCERTLDTNCLLLTGIGLGYQNREKLLQI